MAHTHDPVEPGYGMIDVQGADAAEFLRAQLTNDVLRLGSDRHFLAGWCDAKGRTQLVARVTASADGFGLLVPRALIPATLKRLRMYVLRLDVTLTDISETTHLAGGLDLEGAPGVNETTPHENALWLGLPPTVEGNTRTLIVGRSADATSHGALMALDTPAWQLGTIDAGVPEITPTTQGLFVPQMLNLHWLMAIDFDKGCYPGQEVIARLHYRGRLTRRVFRLAAEGPAPAAGTDILDDADKRVGTVLQAATDAEAGHARLLAVVAVDSATGVLQTADHTALTPLDLPYATPN